MKKKLKIEIDIYTNAKNWRKRAACLAFELAKQFELNTQYNNSMTMYNSKKGISGNYLYMEIPGNE
jgi:hypothetical protein